MPNAKPKNWDTVLSPAGGRKRAAVEAEPLPLVPLESFVRTGPCLPAVAVDWVFEHMRVDMGAAPGEDCPSPGAWGLLMAVQASDARCWEFIKTVWAKRLTRVGGGGGPEDLDDEDGLDVGPDLIDRLLEIRAKAEAEVPDV